MLDLDPVNLEIFDIHSSDRGFLEPQNTKNYLADRLKYYIAKVNAI